MNSRKRTTSEEEARLFRESLAEVRPRLAKRAPTKTRPDVTPKSAKPALEPGIDGRTAERLRRGRLEPEACLDLHDMTEAAAHRALTTFLKHARERGSRMVLVVTGKGLRGPASDAPFDLELHQRPRGILKSLTPRWLKERDLARMIAKVVPAHRRHGGEGALYVYLRKRTP